MHVPEEDRFDDVVRVMEQIRAIDGVTVMGYDVTVSNPKHTGINLSIGIKTDE